MKMQAFKICLILFIVCGLAAVAPAQPPPTTSGGSGMALLNLKDSIALHGYDPVAYFTRNRAVKGSKRIIERLGGAEYHFASRGNRYEFLRDAPRYQPQFGGYCATSLAMGRLDDINPKIFLIYEGKLYLFNNQEFLELFLRDPRRTIYEARQHYFKLATEQRRRY
ncbi:MAG: YHS domain-containing (seleno)protein [Thermodesulfobacteriota bacterium]